ncbi:MAG: EamA family transporter RarD [Planctomycetota bacterium]|nr:EamA family transporter RarD [Planctomycetota bacterium]
MSDLPPSSRTPQSTGQVGVLMALTAFGWWAGVTPLYFHVLDSIPASEQLAWRVVSGLPAMLVILFLGRQLPKLRAILRSPRVLLWLVCSGALLSINWFTFTWAVINQRLVEGSLGYYINPLVSVLLGAIFLGERLRGLQLVAVVIAAIGVAVNTVALGHLPWISLVLAFTFGFYGLIRKQIHAAPGPGVTVEMLLMLPVMVVVLAIAYQTPEGIPHTSWSWTLLLLAGPQTVVPLLFYTGAARRITLSTLGLLQFLAPTGQLLLAVLAFGESFTTGQLLAFALIWSAVIIYSVDTWRRSRVRERSDARSVPSVD